MREACQRDKKRVLLVVDEIFRRRKRREFRDANVPVGHHLFHDRLRRAGQRRILNDDPIGTFRVRKPFVAVQNEDLPDSVPSPFFIRKAPVPKLDEPVSRAGLQQQSRLAAHDRKTTARRRRGCRLSSSRDRTPRRESPTTTRAPSPATSPATRSIPEPCPARADIRDAIHCADAAHQIRRRHAQKRHDRHRVAHEEQPETAGDAVVSQRKRQ